MAEKKPNGRPSEEFKGGGRPVISVLFLWLSSVAGAGLAFATQIVLARTLGVDQFGAFSAAYAVVALLAPVAGFGIAGYWLHVFGREDAMAQRWLPASWRFLILSSSIAILAIFFWAWLGPHGKDASKVLSILSVHVLGQLSVELISSKCQIRRQDRLLACWQIIPHLLRFLGVVLVLVLVGNTDLGSADVAVIFACVALLLTLAGSFNVATMARANIGRSPVVKEYEQKRPSVLDVFKGAWPFGLASVLYLIYYQSDLVLLRYLSGDAAVGLYNVAFVTMAAIYLLPSVVYQRFLLARLHRWAHWDRAKLYKIYRAGNTFMLLLGLLSMVAILFAAPLFFPIIFGKQYAGAISLIQIMALAAPFRFVSSSAGALLTTGGLVGSKIRIMGAVAVFNVAINAALIPYLDAAGAAVSTVLSEMALFIMFYVKARRVMLKEGGVLAGCKNE